MITNALIQEYLLDVGLTNGLPVEVHSYIPENEVSHKGYIGVRYISVVENKRELIYILSKDFNEWIIIKNRDNKIDIVINGDN